MVSKLNSRSSDLDLRSGWGHCIVFLGKTPRGDSHMEWMGMLIGDFEFNP